MQGNTRGFRSEPRLRGKERHENLLHTEVWFEQVQRAAIFELLCVQHVKLLSNRLSKLKGHFVVPNQLWRRLFVVKLNSSLSPEALALIGVACDHQPAEIVPSPP